MTRELKRSDALKLVKDYSEPMGTLYDPEEASPTNLVEWILATVLVLLGLGVAIYFWQL